MNKSPMNEKAKQMVKTLKSWFCPDNLYKEEGVEGLIQDVYNAATDDAEAFIDTMIDKNPMHKGVLLALKNEMFPGMYISDSTK